MAARLLRTVASALEDFLFPPVCLVCERDTGAGDIQRADGMKVEGGEKNMGSEEDGKGEKDKRCVTGEFVCRACFESIYKIERNFCQKCGRPLERSRKEGVCSQCVRHPLSLSRIRAWARFTHPLDKMVYAFKYQRRSRLADFFSRRLALVISSDPFLKSAHALVPVPLFLLKSWWRGYNQSEILARSLASSVGIFMWNALVRRKSTRTQTKLSAAGRRANVRGAFVLSKKFDASLLSDKKLILLDDVITSGSTLDEAARVLLDAGAAEVYGLTIGGAWIDR